jgi:hypothetical protein
MAVASMILGWIGFCLFAAKIQLLMTSGTLWATHLSASVFAHPLDVLLLPGASPSTVVAYAPFAAIGLGAFTLAHVAVIPLALVALGRVATARGLSIPTYAALVAFGSPAFVGAGLACLPGADAALLVSLALYALDVRGSRLGGGAALSALGLVRPELLVISVGIAIARRDRTLALLSVLFPLIHAAAGVLFSGGLEWLVAYLSTPALSGPPNWPPGLAQAVSAAMSALLSVCPLIGLLGFLDFSEASRLDRADAFVAFAFVVLVVSLGIADVGGVGLGAERLLPALPLFAPLLARALCQLADGREATMGVVVVAVLAVTLLLLPTAKEWRPEQALFLWAAIVTLTRVFRRAKGAFVVLGTIAGLLLMPWTQLGTWDQTTELAQTVAFLESDEGSPGDRRIVTDVPLLRHLLAPSPRLSSSDVAFLWVGRAAAPIEVDGQIPERVRTVLVGHPFGEPLFDPSPDATRTDDVMVVAEDAVWARFQDAPGLERTFSGRVRVYERSPRED